ncbi:MAG: geranylgeranyl reductase family protein [Nakamurella sp.]
MDANTAGPEMLWDVVIVGAGPAGAAAALAALKARPDASVLLLDAAEFPRDKVCGDGVAPQALDVLGALGVDLDALVAGTEPITSLDLVSPSGVRASGTFARPARVIPRKVFDERLVRAALAAGAQLAHCRVRSILRRDDHVLVADTYRARVVIGADGAESVVRRSSGAAPPPAGTVAVALRGYVPADPWPAGRQLLRMTTADWPAYAWVFPVGDGTANVGYGQLLTGTPPSRAHLTLRLGELVPDAVGVQLHGHRLPLSTGRPVFGHDRVLLVGDAASLINPLTGEGIYYAVLSGSLAGAAVMTADPVAHYRLSMRKALGKHLRQSDLVSRASRRPGFVDVATAAAGADRRLFGSLVEFGLADGRLGVRDLAGLLRALLHLPR